MWRCTTADETPDHPYLTTLNGYQGRHVWVFDADAGSKKERAEVEQLRADFAANRHRQKHSSDLLYRRACSSKHKTRTLLQGPGAKLPEGAAVTDSDVHDSLKAATAYYTTLQVLSVFGCRNSSSSHKQLQQLLLLLLWLLLPLPASAMLWLLLPLQASAMLHETGNAWMRVERRRSEVSVAGSLARARARQKLWRCISHALEMHQQADDGHWPGDYGGPMFLMPGMIITLYTTGALNTVLSPAHTHEMVRYLVNHQNDDGGYGLHIEGHSTMFGTVLRLAVPYNGACANVQMLLLGRFPVARVCVLQLQVWCWKCTRHNLISMFLRTVQLREPAAAGHGGGP